MFNLIWRNAPSLPVVESVQEQTAQAANLAGIAGQDLLVDPRTNPALRPHFDRLLNTQQRLQLDAEHGRAKRRHRVADKRAADAELTLDAIQQARQASSAARSVLALHRGRTRFMTASLLASLAASCGSAKGVEALAIKHHAPHLTGYVAEVGMVGLSTMAILYRAHLSQHGWKGALWKQVLFGVFAVVPLLASVVANAFGAGPVGVACSMGAAAFGVFSHLVGETSAEALLDKAEEVSGDDEEHLRKIATGGDLFATAPAAQPAPQVTDSNSAQATTQATDPKGDPDGFRSPTQAIPEPLTQVTQEAVTQGMDQVTPDEVTQATSQVTPQATRQVTRKAGRKSPSKPRTKSRRTDAELIAELEGIVAHHYRENPGQEINVKPVAAQLGIGRDRARRLLDQMNVRPMRKAI